MIDLKDFIASVLIDINQGIKEAEQKTGEIHVLDNYGEHGDKGIQFDIAIAAMSEATGKTGAEIKVISLGSIGAKGDAKVANQKVSRIKFTVLRSNSSTLNEESDEKVHEDSHFPDVKNKIF